MIGRTMRFFPHCRCALLSWCAAFLAMAFLSGVNVFAAPEAAPKSKQGPPEILYGTWVAKDVDAKAGEVTIKLSFREDGGLKLVAWSELIFAGKVKETKGPYKVRGDTISSKAIRGGTKAEFWFEGEQLVLQFEDVKIVTFRRESETR
jgi:Cu/Ag efflux protein CusF